MEANNSNFLKSPSSFELINRMKAELSLELVEQSELNTEYHIERFLKARDYNFEKAKTMLLNYLIFRKKKNLFRIASIDIRGPEILMMREFYPSNHYGFDFEGRLIIIEKVGKYNYKDINKNFSIEELEDFFIQIQERLLFVEFPILSKIFNRRIDRAIVIADLKNVKILDFAKKDARRFIEIASGLFQDYYPEILAKSYIVNAPFGSTALWRIVKMVIDKKTADKFEICSDNGHKRLASVLNVADLPEDMGGQNPVTLNKGFGPTIEELEKSYIRKSLFLENRSAEFEYFYTSEERKNMLKNEEKYLENKEKTIYVKEEKNVINSEKELNVSKVRIEKYFKK